MVAGAHPDSVGQSGSAANGGGRHEDPPGGRRTTPASATATLPLPARSQLELPLPVDPGASPGDELWKPAKARAAWSWVRK